MDRNRHRHFPVLVIGLLFAVGVAPSSQAGPGDLDVRFGTHGQTQIPGQVESAALIPLPDGRILVFGVPGDPIARSDGAIAVARLLANGAPDAAFGPGGHLDLRLGSDPLPVPTDALLLPDGRILVAGYFRGTEYGHWPADQPRSAAPGWLVRLSPDAALDPTFGVGGVARAGARGVDRIAMLFDGAIAAAAPGLLHRLEPNGTPAPFPGTEISAVAIGSIYDNVSAMLLMSDSSVIASSGFWDGWDISLVLDRVSASGEHVRDWSAPGVVNAFNEVASLATDSDRTRLLACGNSYSRGSSAEALLVLRLQSDGELDPTFAPETGGRVELGVETRSDFTYWRTPRCRALLRDSEDGYLVVGDRSNRYEYGGGHILLARLNALGAIDTAFDPSGRGKEIAVGTPDQWSGWYVTDAAFAANGAALLLARRAGEQRTLIARLEVSPSQGVGSIGFNDMAARIAERQPGNLGVYRSGGTAGSISVRFELLHDTADGDDVAHTAGSLTWADGDASSRAIPLMPVDDTVLEGEETFRIRLSEPTGGAGLGVPEIEVTIEDDEALRALQFTEPELRLLEGASAEVVIMRPAATRGSILARYAVAPDLDPLDGAPRPAAHTRIGNYSVGELRWNADDTSSRTLQVSTLKYGYTGARPDDTIYVALADVAGTLRDGNDWKVARITVVDDPAFGTQPPSPPPSTPPPLSPSSGGGAISLAVLPFLALVLLLNLGVRPLAQPRPMRRESDRKRGSSRKEANPGSELR